MSRRGRRNDDDEDYEDSGGDDDEFRPENSRISNGRGIGRGKRSKVDQTTEIDCMDRMKDYSNLQLKKDHISRPIWVTPDNMILLEAFSPIYQQTYDFLVAIAEPEARPEYIHRYRLTQNSLYAAVAIAIDTDTIIRVLATLCKTELPSATVQFIRDCTRTFGKAKLVLKDNKYRVESLYPEVLQELLKHEAIKAARILDQGDDVLFEESIAPQEDAMNLGYRSIIDVDEENEGGVSTDSQLAYSFTEDIRKTVSFQIRQDQVQVVKMHALDGYAPYIARYPLIEEYDFRNDAFNPPLGIDLRPSTKIRPYQEKSLGKMFGNGRARSGLIVLPCGAGKSLTGITATSTIKRATVVVCINNASVKQWKEEFKKYSTIDENLIKMFTSDSKNFLPPREIACILITTFSMLCHTGKRSEGGDDIINAISSREWGLLVLDEVHVAPAKMFSKVLNIVNAHAKLGLTATLVREDDLIGNLNFLVGPKLYEANWMDLTQQGFLANVECSEVWCTMTKEFFIEYMKLDSKKGQGFKRTQQLLYILNPTKFRSCEYLMNYHRERGDKIILFSDDVPALLLYCELLKIPYIYGQTSQQERTNVLNSFKSHPKFNCIGLSKVGDTALDIPEANVIIQVSSHFGSRRQEAQRLGRILRPKPNPTGGFNAFFYTLVSTDTKEMFFSSKRQQYLVDQGYTYQVNQDLAKKADRESKILSTMKQEMDLLNMVLTYKCDDKDNDEDRAVASSLGGETDRIDIAPAVKKKRGKLSSLSGDS